MVCQIYNITLIPADNKYKGPTNIQVIAESQAKFGRIFKEKYVGIFGRMLRYVMKLDMSANDLHKLFNQDVYTIIKVKCLLATSTYGNIVEWSRKDIISDEPKQNEIDFDERLQYLINKD